MKLRTGPAGAERPYNAAGQTLAPVSGLPTNMSRPIIITRRRWLQLVAAAGVGAIGWSGPSRPISRAHDDNFKDMARMLTPLEAQFAAALFGWLDAGKLVRDDGFLYAIDLGLLSIYAAGELDAGKYRHVRDYAVNHFLTNSPNDPLLHHLVQWRVKASDPGLDATGTTESLRLAKALWIGARRFGDSSDADLAVEILRGYARHARVDQNIWFIANYFSLNLHTYANNSFLVDYDPDFVAEVAKLRRDAELSSVAEKSYALLEQGFTPRGLIYDLVQPEVKTLVPELDLAIFSPNDVCGLANCATVADTLAIGRPVYARRVMEFAFNRRDVLSRYYFGRTGEPATAGRAGSFEWATLVRLAASLGQAGEVVGFLKYALPAWQTLLMFLKPSHAYTAAEILLACAAVRRLAAAGT